LLDLISEPHGRSRRLDLCEFRAEAIQEISLSKKKLLYLRRSITPLRDVQHAAKARATHLRPRHSRLFQDVFDHLIRVADTNRHLRDMLSRRWTHIFQSPESHEPGYEAAHFHFNYPDVRDADSRGLRDDFVFMPE